MIQPVIFVVEAEHQLVIGGAQIEFRFGAVVDGEAVDPGGRLEADAVELVVRGRGNAADIAEEIGAFLVLVEVAVAHVRRDLPAIVEIMLEFGAEHLLGVFSAVDVRFAVEGLAVDLAEGRIDDRADIGEEAVADMHLIEARGHAPDRQLGRFVGRNRDLRHDEAAQIMGEIGIVVAAGDLAGQAVGHRAAIAQLVGNVEAGEGVAVAVDADFRVIIGLFGRALAHVVDEAPGIAAAIEHRGRTFQDVDALQHEGIELEAAETVGEQVQAVEEYAGLCRVEAANIDPVGIGIGAEGLGGDARRIAQGFVDLVDDAAVVHLLLADDGDGLRDLVERRIGLGTGRGGFRHVPLDGRVGRALCIRRAARLPLQHDRFQRRVGVLRQRRKARAEREQRNAGPQGRPISKRALAPTHVSIPRFI